MTADLLTTVRAEIDSRLSELRPLLDEYEELVSVIDALVADDPAAKPVSAARGAAAAARTASAGTGSTTRTSVRRSSAKKAASAKTPSAKTPSAKTPRHDVKRTRARRPAISTGGKAILAALEHGSHTVVELVVVSAMPAPDIRRDLRPLLKQKAIVKTDRDGKTAYALPAAGV